LNEHAQRALERLRNPDSAAVSELAAVLVDHANHTLIRELAPPRWIASQLAAALEAATHGDLLRDWVDQRIDARRTRWATEERPLRDWVTDDVIAPLHALVGRPVTLHEELVFRIIDQPEIRSFISGILHDTVHNFRRRVSDLDTGRIGSLGRRAARRGRGLFGQVGRNLSGMAENLVDAVKEEVDQALETRVQEFIDNATAETVATLARAAADEGNAATLGALRLAILDVVLDTPVRQLAAEADKQQPEDLADVVVAAIRAAVAQEDFVSRAETRIAAVLAEAGDQTLGAWLMEIGLAQVWSETTTELLTEHMTSVVSDDPFEAWWEALHAP